jgi:hypothetical protein
VYPKVSGLSHNEIYCKKNKHSLEKQHRIMVVKLTRLTHNIARQLHLLAEGCTVCIFRSCRPVLKLLDTPSYKGFSWISARRLANSAGLCPVIVCVFQASNHGCLYRYPP